MYADSESKPDVKNTKAAGDQSALGSSIEYKIAFLLPNDAESRCTIATIIR